MDICKNSYIKLANTIFSIIIYLLGGLDILLKSFFIIMMIDYITGICKAIYLKKLNSKTGFVGLLKKFGYLLIIILATLVDKIFNDSSMAIRTLVLYFFIANESISILENWGIMGLPLPKKLYQVFEQLKKEE